MVTAPVSAKAEPSSSLPLAMTLLIAWLAISASTTWLSTTTLPAALMATLPAALLPMLALAACSPLTKLMAPPRRNGAALAGWVEGVLSLPSSVNAFIALPKPAPTSDWAMVISPSLPWLISLTSSSPGFGSGFGEPTSVSVLLTDVMLAAWTTTSPVLPPSLEVVTLRSSRASAAMSCRLIAPARPTLPLLSARAVAEVSSEDWLTADTSSAPALICVAPAPPSTNALVLTLTLLIAAVKAAAVLLTATDSAAIFTAVVASALTERSPPALTCAPARMIASVVALTCPYAAPRLNSCRFCFGLPVAGSMTGLPASSSTGSFVSCSLPAAELSTVWRVLACRSMRLPASNVAESFTSTRAVVVPCSTEICSPSTLSTPAATNASPRPIRLSVLVTLLSRSASRSARITPLRSYPGSMIACALNSMLSAFSMLGPHGWPASQPTVTVASALRTPNPVSEMDEARSWIWPLASCSSWILVSSPPVFTAAFSCNRLNGPLPEACTRIVPVTSMARACTRTPFCALIWPWMSTSPRRSICSGNSVPAIRRFKAPPPLRMSSMTPAVGVATDNAPTLSTPPLCTTMPIGSTKNTRPAPMALVPSSTLLTAPLMWMRESQTRLTRLLIWLPALSCALVNGR